MTTNPPPGELLRQARERADLSARRAAELAGVSEGLWRQTELGYRKVGHGLQVPVKTGRERLRRMAQAVNADVGAVLDAAGFDASDVPAASGEPIPVEARQLLDRADDLSSEQRDRWFRLARALADALAVEDERDVNASAGNSGPDGIGTQNVAIDRSIGSHGEQIVAAGPEGATPPTPAEREYADTVSDAALERMRRRHTGE